MAHAIDMKGQKFGFLEVIERDNEVKKEGTYWKCRCVCGNIKSVSRATLKKSKFISCGCKKSEIMSENRANDLTGQRFGKLTVVKRVPNPQINEATWLCKCDCGNEIETRASYLKKGRKKCCGCSKKAYNFIDLTGQRFGKLTVIEKAGKRIYKNGKGVILWNCKCDCGKDVVALGADLRKGDTKSCGCGKINDLTGQKFGMLTVIERANDIVDPSGKNNIAWLCKCDCGNTVIYKGDTLCKGQAKTCGCWKKDLTGQKFGKLTVIKKVDTSDNDKSHIKWECKCECGNTVTVFTNNLMRGHTRSCGCLHKENPSRKTHGLSGNRLYHEYRSMIGRCKPDYVKSYNYFDRGITVCDEWLGENGIKNFFAWAKNNGYSDDLTIDRIDNDKGYSPDNCRWATRKVQQNNRRVNRRVTYKGKTQTVAEWCDELNLNDHINAIYSRLFYGWSVEDTFEKPFNYTRRKKKSN